MTPHEILLADDHALFRAGVKQLLSSIANVVVSGESFDATSTIHALESGSYDLAILDLTMPGSQATSLLRQIHARFPALPILVLSMHDETATVRQALQDGAQGYLTKESSPELLIDAVRQLLSGKRFLAPAIATRIALETPRPLQPHQLLSSREREVFALIVRGVSLTQIAEQLNLSPKTITTHKTHLMEKLGVESNADLIRYAIEHGLF